MADEKWVPTDAAPGQGGDFFAVTVEKRVETKLKLHNGEHTTQESCEATVIVRGSLSARRFLGGTVVEGYEHEVVVVDADAGAPVVVIAHSRDEAPLQAIELLTGEQLWVASDLRGAWALTASKMSRVFGVSYRGSAKLVSADTGKYRWTWRGDVEPVIVDGDYTVGFRDASGAGTAEVRESAHGKLLFACGGHWARDAIVDGSRIVLAGRGLHAFGLDGKPAWRFEPETHFQAIVALSDGVRAYSPERGIVDVRDGRLLREFERPPVLDARFLGPGHLLSNEGVWSIDGHDHWSFIDALRGCAHSVIAVPAASAPEAALAVARRTAERVFHRRFGWGTVVERLDSKTRVKFDDGQERTLADAFLSTGE